MHNQIVRGMFTALCCAAASLALAQNAVPQPSPAGAAPGAPGAPGTTPPVSSYLLATQVDWVPLVAPPPAANSAEQDRDLQAVLNAQVSASTGARLEQALGDVEISCSRIMDVLGLPLDEKKLPKTAAFLGTAGGAGIAAVNGVKKYWKRPRPIVASAKVERRGDMAPGYQEKRLIETQQRQQKAAASGGEGTRPAAGGPPAPAGAPPQKPMTPEEIKKRAAELEEENKFTSYPSGHAAFGTTCAIVLGQMVPEKQAELFARADEYRRSRLIVGAHFPTDIEAGRILATAAAALMSQNFTYQRDLAAARTELRAALKLPAELPPPPHAERPAPKTD